MSTVTSLLNKVADSPTVQTKTVKRNMSITTSQFYTRLLKLKEGIFDSNDSKQSRCTLRNSSGSVDISWHRKSNRYIGSLKLPVIEVNMDFSNYRVKDIERFVQSFDIAFLKMGC